MQIVLLAGGSGKRLWPLSNSLRSKQFLNVDHFSDENSGTMVSMVFGQVKRACPDSDILITTNEKSIAMLETIAEGGISVLSRSRKILFLLSAWRWHI